MQHLSLLIAALQWPVCLSVPLPVCLSVPLSACLSVCHSVCLPVSCSVSLLLVCRCHYLLSRSLYLSLCISICFCLSHCLSTPLSLCLPLCLPVFRSFAGNFHLMLHRFRAKRLFHWLPATSLPLSSRCPYVFPWRLVVVLNGSTGLVWQHKRAIVTATAAASGYFLAKTDFSCCLVFLTSCRASSLQSPLSLSLAADLYRTWGQSTDRQVQHAWVIGSCHYNCISSSTELDRQIEWNRETESLCCREREGGDREI